MLPSAAHAGWQDDDWGFKNPYQANAPVPQMPETAAPAAMDAMGIANPVITPWRPLSPGDGSSQNLQGDDAPVDLQADSLTHDEGMQVLMAQGNVRMVQGDRTLKADAVSYNLQTDRVRATGNVEMSGSDGTIYYADDVEVTQDMKDGFVKGLMLLLTDGSRFKAEEGERTGGTLLTLKQASYTPCEPCKEDPERPPLWQLRAREVQHDKTEKRITYDDAWFEFAGVPLLYTPYFSHPDGSERQKSGFMIPRAGYSSELGASYQQEYYWAIAPDQDLTVGTIVASDANPVALAEYRQRFDNAEVQFNGSGTYSDRPDSVGGETVSVKDEARGHLFGEGLWNINDKWRSGFDIAMASDDQYLRQYDINSDDVLENEIYVERFSGRNYAVGRAMAFQDVRVSERQVDQPAVLPEIAASFYGDPNGLLGGRWSADISALGLTRDGNGQDMARGSVELGWQRRYITGFGLVNKIDALLRGDFYNIGDRPGEDTESRDSNQSRGFAQANWEVSYPFAKRLEQSQIVLSPVASVTGGTNVDMDGDIPNEDSQGFTLDSSNIFETNRFAGYDMIDDRARATYGARAGWYGDNGYNGEIFFGQSRRFEEKDNPFPIGSGLSDQESDYVGQVSAQFAGAFNMDYRFTLDNDSFASVRHELDAGAKWDRLALGVRYFYSGAIEGTDLDESREQIRPTARFRIYDDWHLIGGMRYDFGRDEGLRQAAYGLAYEGQCMTFSLLTERTLTSDATGDSSTEIMLRLGLKNLGEFETSGISIGGGGSSDDDEEDNDIESVVDEE